MTFSISHLRSSLNFNSVMVVYKLYKFICDLLSENQPSSHLVVF